MQYALHADMVTSDDLKRTREALGENQEAFGRHFGVDQSTIHRWEKGGIPTRGATAVAVDRVMLELRARIEREAADKASEAA